MLTRAAVVTVLAIYVALASGDDGLLTSTRGFWVPVFTDVSEEPLRLAVPPGVTFDAAADAFIVEHGLPSSAKPQLVAEITRVARDDSAALPLFTVLVDVDGNMVPLPVYENQRSREAAETFCESLGLTTLPNYEDVVTRIESVILEKYLAMTHGGAAAPVAPASKTVFQIGVDIDDETAQLTVLDGESVEAAVRRFMSTHALSDAPSAASIFDTLVSEVKAALDRAPSVIDFAVEVDGKQVPFSFTVGDDVNAVVDAFIAQHGLGSAGDAAEIATMLVQNVLARMGTVGGDAVPTTQQQAQDAPPAAEPELFGRVVLVVKVDVSDRDAVLPLNVREHHSVLEAVDEFLGLYALSPSLAPTLSQVVLRKLQENNMMLPLFRFALKIRNVTYPMDLALGEDAGAVAAEFLRGIGLASDPEYDVYLVGIIDALHRYLERVGQPYRSNVPPASSIEDGFPTPIATESDYVTSTLTIGGTEYDLEHPRNASFPDIAKSFCQSEWDFLQPLLQEGLGFSVSTQDCGDVVARFMGEQWGRSSQPTPGL